MFKDFNLSDNEVIEIIEKYKGILDKYSRINGVINEDLRQEIIINWYKKLTKNREK